MNQKTISDFLSNEYKEFAMYSIENRAIPSVIDGLKPSQRKVIHVANQIWKTGKEKTLKVFQLAGKVASDAFYHHGNVSLENTIITMAQKFKNNAPLLEEEGQFGSLRAPEAGASRYIGTKLSDNFRYLYKDFELLEYKEEDGEKIEPKYFLPIIPTILINGSSGIAVGFSTNILNRDINQVIDQCINCLKGKKVEDLKPSLNCFKGEYIKDRNNNKRWIIRGKFEIISHNEVRITELPPSMTYEKYENVLDKLLENKIIVSFEDNCKDNIDYILKFEKSVLDNYKNSKNGHDELIKLLKLEEYETEIYTTLDENGKLKIFDSVSDIIVYFVNFRLKYYDKRKEHLLSEYKHEMKIMYNKIKFIEAVLNKKININNKTKDEIIKQIENNNIEKIDDGYDYLLKMPIYSLSKDLFNKLKYEFNNKQNEIKIIENTSSKDMYLADLKELKSKFK